MRLLGALILVTGLYAGAPLRHNGNTLKWKDSRIAMQLSRTVHLPDPASGAAHEESAASLHTAVMEAVRLWNDAGQPQVTVSASLTDESSVQPGLNLITFTDTAPFASGLCNKQLYIACTILTFSVDTGEIQNASIAFNPYLRHSSIGLAGTHDIGLVMLHEMGHALGLDHSPLLNAAMAASVELAGPKPGVEFSNRQLSSDDVLTLALVYPPAEADLRGTVRGTILRNEQPWPGAHIFAFDLTGQPVYGSLSETNGAYSLTLPPGDYRLAAEPLDDPAPQFPTLFWTVSGGQSNTADTITVHAGQVRAGIDFVIPDLPVVNVDSIGLVHAGLYLGGARVTVGRGREYILGLTRTPPQGVPGIGFWQAPIIADGLANFPTSAPQLIRQKIQIPAGAAPGAYSVHYFAEDTGSLLAGALRIVPSPVITSINTTNQFLSIILSIRGTDLAILDAVAKPWAEASVHPNQLAGTSVRVGGRWAPLFAVTPSEILAELPAGLTGETTEVRVVTGAGVESNAITLTLAQ